MRFVRLLLASCIGATCATLYAILPNAVKITFQILLAPAMTLIFDKYASKSTNAGVKKRMMGAFVDYIKSLITFVLFTYMLGGIVIGLSFVLHVDVKSYALLGIVALSVAILLIVARAVVYKRNNLKKRVCDVVCRVGAVQLQLHALCDSGNLLTDTLTGLPIVILSNRVCDRLSNCHKEGFVDVDTVGGQNSLPLIMLDEIDVSGKKFCALGALSQNDFGDYDVILQYTMF